MPLSATFNFSPYLPEDAATRLPKYQYRAEDKSYLYNYFWRPFCRWSVERLPVWLAPNVITVTGLGFVILVHIALAIYMPDVTFSVNETPEGAAILPVAQQEKFIHFGVPLGSDSYAKLSAVTAVDAPGSTAAPTWLFVAAGIALFLYQYLDNMDGHQARRTGTSSPLGLLMDHGCDAVNCVIGSLSIATACCCGPTWKTWSVVSSAVIVFFMNTWEEYYRGALVLPVVNGANEGLVIAAMLYFTSAAAGAQFWLQYVTLPLSALPAWLTAGLDGVPLLIEGEATTLLKMMLVDDHTVGIMLNSFLVIFMASAALFTSLGNIMYVYGCVRGTQPGDPHAHGKYAQGWLLRRFPFVHALTRLFPLAVITVLANVWVLTSPARVFREHPRVACWTFGLLYTKLVTHLMIAHLCETEFHPLRRTLIPFLYCGLHMCLSEYSRPIDRAPWGDEGTLLKEFFVISTVTYLHLAVNAVEEMATALKVPLFTVPKAKQEATLATIRAAASEASKKQR